MPVVQELHNTPLPLLSAVLHARHVLVRCAQSSVALYAAVL